MKKKDEEIGLAEIAVVAGVHRQTAYWACRTGEIAGAHLFAGQMWVARRSQVMKYKRRREREEKLRREAGADKPFFAVGEAIREGMAQIGATAGDVARRLK